MRQHAKPSRPFELDFKVGDVAVALAAAFQHGCESLFELLRVLDDPIETNHDLGELKQGSRPDRSSSHHTNMGSLK